MPSIRLNKWTVSCRQRELVKAWNLFRKSNRNLFCTSRMVKIIWTVTIKVCKSSALVRSSRNLISHSTTSKTILFTLTTTTKRKNPKKTSNNRILKSCSQKWIDLLFLLVEITSLYLKGQVFKMRRRKASTILRQVKQPITNKAKKAIRLQILTPRITIQYT